MGEARSLSVLTHRPVAAGERATDVLADLSAAVYDRLYPVPVGDAAGPQAERRDDAEWVSVADLLVDPAGLDPLVEACHRRFRSDDHYLVVAQVARESVAALAAAAVDLWVRQRRVFDLSAANVVLRAGETSVLAGVRQARLAVLDDDPMVTMADPPGPEGVTAVHEAALFDRLVDQSIGYPVAAGAVPPGHPGSIAAIAAVIAAVRSRVRCGERHLWGTVAQAVASTGAHLSHTVGRRADVDRDAVLGVRPDLARTIELITVEDETDETARPDGCGDTITFSRRRTCCLLFKLPDASQCGTCSLKHRDAQIVRLAEWHHNERRRLRISPSSGADSED